VGEEGLFSGGFSLFFSWVFSAFLGGFFSIFCFLRLFGLAFLLFGSFFTCFSTF
jgi:hypothetical protein